MKTKTLLLTASLGLLGAASSFAQVYSVNAVGYINQTTKAGRYDVWVNQLSNGDNKIGTVIPSAPDGSQVLVYDTAAQALGQPQGAIGGGWYDLGSLDLSATVLAPGTGFFFYAVEDGTITFVGDVPQGDAVTVPLAPGVLNLVGSAVPQAGTLSALGLNAGDGDFFQSWNVNTGIQGDLNAAIGKIGTDWFNLDTLDTAAEPTVAVGQGFFFNNASGSTWVRNFHVNP